MKIQIIILATVLISSQAKSILDVSNEVDVNLSPEDLNNPEKKLFEYSLDSKLEEIRDILKNGNQSLGLPVCDPFKLDHWEEKLNLFNGSIKGSGSIDNLIFTGLSSYKIIESDVSIFKRAISLQLKWPRLEGISFYIINAFIKNKMIEIYGGGDFQTTTEDLVFDTVVYFGLKDGKVYIKKMDTRISLKNFKFTITGLYYDEDVSRTMSIFLTEFVKQVIRDNQKNLVNVVNSFIMINANKYLSKLTFQDLLELLS
ncbi:uncharacterized protein LOC122498641 [Leptopilina heterotoma]|uniref:uncharacterized protein LOC122498641 n=1 Tax=Leptopilina heterotoma TaxID=63436 RepID=UPI001CA94B2F|nr:uncharacterized protein LOC122498641 [Leptopilina heterotoma]